MYNPFGEPGAYTGGGTGGLMPNQYYGAAWNYNLYGQNMGLGPTGQYGYMYGGYGPTPQGSPNSIAGGTYPYNQPSYGMYNYYYPGQPGSDPAGYNTGPYQSGLPSYGSYGYPGMGPGGYGYGFNGALPGMGYGAGGGYYGSSGFGTPAGPGGGGGGLPSWVNPLYPTMNYYNPYNYGGYSGGYSSYPYSYYNTAYSPPEVSTVVADKDIGASITPTVVEPIAVTAVVAPVTTIPIPVPPPPSPAPIIPPPPPPEITAAQSYGFTDVVGNVGMIGANTYWYDYEWNTWRQIL